MAKAKNIKEPMVEEDKPIAKVRKPVTVSVQPKTNFIPTPMSKVAFSPFAFMRQQKENYLLEQAKKQGKI